MRYIKNQYDLEKFVDEVIDCSILAVDTEFLREKTYYPKLCLLQLAADDLVAIVDPFAIDDLRAINVLFENPGIVKVFHAATQDLEILYNETGCLPEPIFDTQIAAALLGYSHQVGLANLVNSMCGAHLKKADSFTDWSRRPLTDSQIEYASGDVIFLPELYICMKSMLEKQNRLSWLDDDFAELIDPKRYEIDPYLRFLKLKRGNQLSKSQLAAARDVTAWRELQAQMRNIPRKWVLSDEQIVEACKREAKTIDELYLIRGMREKLPVKDARILSTMIKNALESDPKTWPELSQQGQNEPNVDSAIDLMLALCRVRAKESGIALQTLASHDDFANLARGHFDQSALTKGWRKDLIGQELIDLLNGKISLSLDQANLVVDTK